MNGTMLLGFAVMGAVVLGSLVFFAREWRAGKYVALETLAGALGLRALGDQAFAPTAGGERQGFAVLVQWVERHDGLPPRLDVLLHARLELTPAGAVTVQPSSGAAVEGPAEVLPKLEAVKDAVLAAAALVGGRLQLRALDSLRPDASFHDLGQRLGLARWSGMMLRTWLPLDAPADDVERALSGLLAARAQLVNAPGVTAR
ncbi:MAG: hypothetical protein ACOZQL_26430 [Myxococcota bacterium]